uniref:RE1-silencing transcription factor n=1 Tax=Cyprinus carpio carpio TaxID=630221 RepID=A0A8C1GYA4_CYPCA
MSAQTVYPATAGIFMPVGIPLPEVGHDLPELPRNDVAAPQLVMLANVVVSSEASSSDYNAEEKQMVELKNVGCNNYSDSEEEGRCGYNTNRYDHYMAHLKHHTKEGEDQRVFKCTICAYTTISQYHWKKHLRNHFPSKLFTCNQCSYFSDRKNNYIQHIRTHTGERPFQCIYCDYSSSQKTHLTRHMRTHSEEREPTLKLPGPPGHKSTDAEDDEGIHSNDGGSDISDSASEGSYDSGLNGLAAATESGEKLPETPTEELPSPTKPLSHTCIFCDRTFSLEMDYRRHLNRHLVNVYYLEGAAQGDK